MSNKVKVPGGAFYVGDGLTVDKTTRTVSAGGGSSVSTPDWNQNDATASDYIKNRPFYTGDTVGTVLLQETTATFAEKGGLYGAEISADFSLEIGTTYKVSWDGTVYSCVCYEFSRAPVIGNQYILTSTSDTGEPFIVIVDPNNGTLTIITQDTSASHTFSISVFTDGIVKIDEKYIPELPYMDKVNPTGTGAFSLNRAADTTIGKYSFAEGLDTTASGYCSYAEGWKTTASGENSHAEGWKTTASGEKSHAEGYNTIASGDHSHAEGCGTKASSTDQHVQGKYNVEDSSDTYAHIVGNGTANNARSNAHTLDWSGNAWYAGTVEGKALILPSSTTDSTKKFKITVDDSGTITATEVT